MVGHTPIVLYALAVLAAFFGFARKTALAQSGEPRSADGSMKVGLAIALIFLARFAVAAWVDPAQDGDIAWQQWLGLQILHTGHIPSALGHEAFAAAGAPWVAQEWALSILLALTLGSPWFVLLAALTVCAAGATLMLTAISARRLGSSTIATAIAVLLVACSMVESYGIRAQVFAWAMLAAVMFVLRTAQGRSRWWIVLLVAIWANLHASALLAPFLLALWTAGTALQDRAWSPRVRELTLLTIACAGAVFVTPLGYRLPLYAVALVQSPIRIAINEWQPADITQFSFAAGALAAILGTCLFGVERSRRWQEILIFAAVTWMALSAARNVPVCAIVLAPALAQRLSAYLPDRLRINMMFSERGVTRLLWSATSVAALLAGFALASTNALNRDGLPVRAIAALQTLPGTHNLYCEDFAWCSLALAYPNMREFIDGRCDPFPLLVWNDYETIYRAKGSWREILDRRGVDAIVVSRKHALAKALPKLHQWRLVYSDETYRLFVRIPREARAPSSTKRSAARRGEPASVANAPAPG